VRGHRGDDGIDPCGAGAERDQRRAEQPLADVAEATRRASAGVLLVEDDLLAEAEAAAAEARL